MVEAQRRKEKTNWNQFAHPLALPHGSHTHTTNRELIWQSFRRNNLLDVMRLIHQHWPYQCRHHSRWVAVCRLCRPIDMRPGTHSQRRISLFVCSDLLVNWMLDLCRSLPIVSAVRPALTQPNCCVHRMTFWFSLFVSFFSVTFLLFLFVSLSATLARIHSIGRLASHCSLCTNLFSLLYFWCCWRSHEVLETQNFGWKTNAKIVKEKLEKFAQIRYSGKSFTTFRGRTRLRGSMRLPNDRQWPTRNKWNKYVFIVFLTFHSRRAISTECVCYHSRINYFVTRSQNVQQH